MPHQSLYRRFRPQRFGEVVGQPHLIRALSNALSEDRVGHAYLLSGPRGTGKTSTARILAKALNCEALGDDGEPCDDCASCRAVASGTSMDLIELDAASNNSVNHVRDLTERAALVSAGRRKVYLLDEVHMLSAAAANALLKTLEEPPSHVVFILATTDPQKVLPTIRSRTQQFALSLVGADEMAPHVRAVAERAGMTVDDAVVDYVTECGGGSVRDALSALDTVLAAGGIPDDRSDAGALVRALAAGDLSATLTAVAGAVSAGVDARDLAERTARRLRDMFLVEAGVTPAELPAADVESARELGQVMGRRATVRALEALGKALAQMPQSADRRLTLETALVALLADDLLGEEHLRPRQSQSPRAAEPQRPPPARRPPPPPPRPGRKPPPPAPPDAVPDAAAADAASDGTSHSAASADPDAAQPSTALGGSSGSGVAATAGSSASGGSSESGVAVATAGSSASDGVGSGGSSSAGLSAAASASSPVEAQTAAAPDAAPAESDAVDSASAPISVADLQSIWREQIAARLKATAQGLFVEAVVTAVDRNVVKIQIPHKKLLERTRNRKNEVEAVLSDHYDRTIRVEVEAGQPPPASGDAPSAVPAAPPQPSTETASPPAAPATPSGAARSPDADAVAVADSGEGRVASAPQAAAAAPEATARDSKVQRIVDYFPGAVVVPVDADAS